MASRSPEEENASIVLVGSFNPAILHPEWFAKHGLISDAEAENATVEIVSPALTTVQFAWFTLEVMDGRFLAMTQDPAQYPALQECVSGIFSLLEFTPITAMGLNTERHVRAPTEDIWTPLERVLAPCELWAKVLPGLRSGAPSLGTVSVLGNRPDSPAERLNVTIKPSQRFQPGLYLGTNEHFAFIDDNGAREPMAMLRENWIDSLRYASGLAERLMELVN